MSTGVFGVESDARESPIDRKVGLGPIGIFLFSHYSTICCKGF